MKTLLHTVALVLILAGCSSGNTSGLPAPLPDTVEYNGRLVAVDGWVEFRGIDIPWVEVGKAPNFTLPAPPHFKTPLLTVPVKAQLAAIGLEIRSELDERRIMQVIIEETGL